MGKKESLGSGGIESRDIGPTSAPMEEARNGLEISRENWRKHCEGKSSIDECSLAYLFRQGIRLSGPYGWPHCHDSGVKKERSTGLK
jgi:hypothetical protein